MHAADRPVLVALDLLGKRFGPIGRRHVRQQFRRGLKRQRQHQKIRHQHARSCRQRPLRCLFVPLRALHTRVEDNLAAVLAQILLSARHTARSAARVLIPMLPACAEFKNSSRITFAAYGSAITSTSALSALAITSRQKRSIAPGVCPLRLSHAPSVSCESAGTGRISARNARASAILSARVNAFAASSLGNPCKGAGNHRDRPKQRPPSAWLDHRHRARPVDSFRHADAPVKPNQIRAAAKQHMLAVVDHFIDARMPIGTRAPAQVAAPLHELHAQPGLGQRARRAHAGHAPANHNHRFAYDSLWLAHALIRSA